MTDTTFTEESRMRQYYLMWSGQTLSVLASAITNFALGLWILKQTNSVTEFVTVFVITTLPGIVLAPFIGALIDRHSRKMIIILADTVAAITTLLIVYLYTTDSLTIWAIYVVAGIDSIALAFHMPATMAAISMLVPQKNLGKVAGLGQITGSLAMIAGPFLAGMLLSVMDLGGILAIDLATFVFAAGMMIFIKIPSPPKAAEQAGQAGAPQRPSLVQEAILGWTYIKERKGLAYLLVYFALMNLVGAMVIVSVLPMAQHFATEGELGVILALGGFGGLAGGMILGITGGPSKKINGVIFGGLLAGVSVLLLGLQPSVILTGAALLMFNISLPIINGSSQVIWQMKVEPAVQGRVFATRRMLAQITLPIGAASVGPLADQLFEPMMAKGGELAGSVGGLIGTGPGRGVALILIGVSVLPILFSLFAMGNRTFSRMEEDLPDMVPQSGG